MKRKVLFRLSLYVLDTVTIFLSYVTAVVLRYHIMDSEPGINALSMPYLLIALIYSLIMANVIQIINGTGKYFYRNDYFENVKLMSAQAIGCLVLLSFFYIANVIYFSRWALVLFWLFSCMFSIIRNGVVRSYLHKKRKAVQNKIHVLVIGDGKYAEEYMNAVFEYPEYGFNIFGYLGKKSNAPPICLSKWNSNDLKEQTTEIPCRGEYYDLKTILKTNDINEVVFALVENVHVDLEHLFNDAKKTDVNITMFSNYNKLIPKNPTVQEIGGVKQLVLGNEYAGLRSMLRLGLTISVSVLILFILVKNFNVGTTAGVTSYRRFESYKSILFAISGFFTFLLCTPGVKN